MASRRTRTSHAFNRRETKAPKKSPQTVNPSRNGPTPKLGTQTARTTARTASGTATERQEPRTLQEARDAIPTWQLLSAETFDLLIRQRARRETPATLRARNQPLPTTTQQTHLRTHASQFLNRLATESAITAVRNDRNYNQENIPPPSWVQPSQRLFVALEGLQESYDPNIFANRPVPTLADRGQGQRRITGEAAGLPAFFQ